MRRKVKWVGCAVAALIVWSLGTARPTGQVVHRPSTIAAATPDSIRQWDEKVDRMLQNHELILRKTIPDGLISGRSHDRMDQYFHGVRVFGGDVSRQTDHGLTVSIFGLLYDDIDIGTTPTLNADDAEGIITQQSHGRLRAGATPELVILPTDSGEYKLTYTAEALTQEGPIVYFVNALTGAVVLTYNNRQRDDASVVRQGKGVLNDDKKVSMTSQSGTYVAIDQLRPPAITTYDMRADLNRTIGFLNGFVTLGNSDVASTSQTIWTDGMAVDAQTYLGWTYDFYYKRFNRKGLDDRNIPLRALVHTVDRSQVFYYPISIIGTFFVNAFYDGDGVMVFGEGLPEGLTLGGQSWNYMSGAIDVIAHELTHGVTDYTSRLIYQNESGALNEAFSDCMGTAVEFYYAAIRNHPGNYLMGEDIITPGGIRSMADPLAFGDPDNYSIRYTGAADNGGVHTNSGIMNNAFYLAIEGGRNRTSGILVGGVGASNRQQIENAYYRAFALMLPANATFAMARQATVQAALDLGTPVAAASIAAAWTAVGVN